MDLRNYTESIPESTLTKIKQLFWYQPFIFTDTLRSGVSPYWDRILEAGDSPTPPSLFDKDLLQKERPNLIDQIWRSLDVMRSSSDYLIRSFVNDLLSRGFDIASSSFLDIGCNCGQYCFYLAEAGVRDVLGIDAYDYGPNIDIIKEITGIDFVYQNTRYNPYTHRIDELDEDFDFVIANNVLAHLHDPIETINCFSLYATKALFLFAITTDDEEFTVRYTTDVPWQGAGWPYQFDTTISKTFCRSLLQRSGFSEIREMTIPKDVDFHPYWRNDVTFFVAYKE